MGIHDSEHTVEKLSNTEMHCCCVRESNRSSWSQAYIIIINDRVIYQGFFLNNTLPLHYANARITTCLYVLFQRISIVLYLQVILSYQHCILFTLFHVEIYFSFNVKWSSIRRKIKVINPSYMPTLVILLLTSLVFIVILNSIGLIQN